MHGLQSSTCAATCPLVTCAPVLSDHRGLPDICMHVCCLCVPGLQAALNGVVCVGVTPRELSMVALTALTAWQAGTSQQQAGLLPEHVAGALRGWMGQHDSRVSLDASHCFAAHIVLVCGPRLLTRVRSDCLALGLCDTLCVSV